MDCREAKPLVPGYLDGELTEAQAAPLRRHLMDCPECRGVAQDDKVLEHWFVDWEPAAVPTGFAARVARRAYAGDTGESFSPAAAEERGEGRVLSFVLQLTAVAAAALIALSISFKTLSLPQSGDLRADDFTFEKALSELDELNAAEEETETEDREEREE